MVFDKTRNDYYGRAIAAVVNQNTSVLDLGAGLGIHGLIAARCGARHVYLVDPADVVDIARQVANDNGFGDRVSCIRQTIEDTTIPEKVDLISSVFTGNFLYTEDLLPSLFYARDQFLKSDGKMIPDRARTFVVPVTAPKYYQDKVDVWSDNYQGLDYSSAKFYSSNTLYYEHDKDIDFQSLSVPTQLSELDFMTATTTDVDAETTLQVEKDGLCHGWLGWFDMRLGDEWLSTAPEAPNTHWSVVFMPLSEPVPLTTGEQLGFRLTRIEHGDWTWRMSYRGITQKQSTYLSQPIELASFKRKSNEYRPDLNKEGAAIDFVFSKMDGKHSMVELIRMVERRHPDLFKKQTDASRFVRNLAKRYG